MPEGDTVWLAARRLHEALAGRQLVHAELRVPKLADTDLTGRDVLEVVARGKHLLVRLSGGLSVRTHLGMAGEWRVAEGVVRPGTGRDDLRAVLATDAHTALGYRLVRVDLLRTDQESRLLAHLGPDLTADQCDLAEAARRLAAAPDRPLGRALLDQRVVAGVGNAFRSEILFVLGLPPTARVRDAPDVDRVVALAREMLLANRTRTARSTAGSLRRGDRLWVYGRTGAPCRRCGTAVRRDDDGGRVVYWCPVCQTLPARPPGSARQTVPTRRNPSRA